MKKSIFSLLIAVFVSIFSFSQIENPFDKVTWNFSVDQETCDATIIATITMQEHWHISPNKLPATSFAIPTDFILEKSDNYKIISDVVEPESEHSYDSIIKEDIYLHSGTIKMKIKVKITSKEDFTLKGSYAYQTCDDTHCLPPYGDVFEIKVSGCQNPSEITEETNNSEELEPIEETQENTTVENTDTINTGLEESANTLVTTNNENKKEDKEDKKSLLVIFILSFLSGFAALLTPCVFPMIPMTVSFFTKQSKTKAAGIRNAIYYGISIIVIYVLLGTIVTAVFGSDALNAMATNVSFNIIFFVLLVVFAISFMGAFEITLPNSWLNKADKASDKGGLIGIFFMALALALVSFSCTGPIVGTLLVEAATIGGIGPFVGMFGFSLALALPFGLFAAFPGWLNSLPKSGGWLNTVKVVLGFLELALAFKFLSNADLVVQGHYLERELFLAIWIGVFAILALYLFGKISLPHDSPIERLSVGRTLLGITTVIFVIYLIPGLWGAPLKLISGFPPPMAYSESPLGFGGGSGSHSDGTHDMHLGEHGIMLFHDYDKGVAYANKIGKPALLDFTGWACVNCRRMEAKVWGDPEVLTLMKNAVVIISLYVDEKTELPKGEQDATGFVTYGNKWSDLQKTRYKISAQPYYRLLGPNNEDLENGSADYKDHGTPEAFKVWLEEGLDLYNKAK
jgi:thiol:disulfide interchange protein